MLTTLAAHLTLLDMFTLLMLAKRTNHEDLRSSGDLRSVNGQESEEKNFSPRTLDS
jgi:hypothetical protein